jgi:hypothetical protein
MRGLDIINKLPPNLTAAGHKSKSGLTARFAFDTGNASALQAATRTQAQQTNTQQTECCRQWHHMLINHGHQATSWCICVNRIPVEILARIHTGRITDTTVAHIAQAIQGRIIEELAALGKR